MAERITRSRQRLAPWVETNIIATDGPDAGRVVKLEPWQRGVLAACEGARYQTVAVRGASQVGKTLVSVAVATRCALDGAGALAATATNHGSLDFGRRLDAILHASPKLAAQFVDAGSGRKRSRWNQRETVDGLGWLGIATAGSPSGLASRTARVLLADEIARWPPRVTSGEGSPLALARARLADWGDRGKLIAISSPTLREDAICALHDCGDRRRLHVRCPTCRESTTLEWDAVTGREQGEVPRIACQRCGSLHSETTRRRMLRGAKWIATVTPEDETVASFALSRLDSRRASLAQVCQRWREARRESERDPAAWQVFANTVCGSPSSPGSVDVDQLMQRRVEPSAAGVLQVTVGVDVQADRLVVVAVGWRADDTGAILMAESVIGDPCEASVWEAFAGRLEQLPLPAAVVGVDAGYSTGSVQAACALRRRWVPCVGRAGAGPIASPIGPKGLAVVKTDAANAEWHAMAKSGRLDVPRFMDRAAVREMFAAEALTVVRGRATWAPIRGQRQNHLLDAGRLALWGHRFSPPAARSRPVFGVVAGAPAA